MATRLELAKQKARDKALGNLQKELPEIDLSGTVSFLKEQGGKFWALQVNGVHVFRFVEEYEIRSIHTNLQKAGK